MNADELQMQVGTVLSCLPVPGTLCGYSDHGVQNDRSERRCHFPCVYLAERGVDRAI
jgi:hypothetical protein